MHGTSFLAAAKRSALFVMTGLFLLSATRCDAQIFHKKKKVNKSTSAENTAEPDKILYDKAMDDVKHGRHEVGRLNLQTLINTYPDSEYLAKAKLAIADSFYKEGGTANMTQAVQAYKDFGIFFPMLPEAAYAQLQVAMTHYKQMEKPDRDRTHARAAEDEFQTFLSKYPNDPLAPKAEQHLREVQELLAEGDFRIGYYYYVKEDKKAAESRLRAIVNRYPLYSKSDQALWMLGNIWQSTEKKELAAPYYARIVRNYPLSPLVPNAKNRLKTLGAPVPQPDPQAVAWMTAEQNAPRQREMLIKKPLALIRSGPGQEMRTAATIGKPTMTPESESEAGIDVLTGGGKPQIGGAGTGIVATVRVGGSSATTDGAENVAPTAGEGDANPPAQPDPTAPAAAGSSAAGTTTAAGTADTAPKTDATPTGEGQTTDASKTDGSTVQDGTQNGANGDGKKESTSKKKKGLRKVLPW
ncbi:MAG TPA: outer membrane protein assembly factor BamD [Candidatus Acidoferrales bacterium]|nr:outer membrane protein assembly factor BamD [Candidatus Acidoferrales bacterium]